MLFLVSQPPYDVEKALKPAAVALEIIPYEMRSKLSYALPEVWKIYDVPEKTSSTLKRLRDAGIKALLISAEELGNVPPLFSAISFLLSNGALTAKNKLGEALKLPWGSIRIAVLLQRITEGKTAGAGTTGGQEPGARLGRFAAGVGNLLVPGLGSVVLSARNRMQQALKTSLGAGAEEAAVERILDIYAEPEKEKWSPHLNNANGIVSSPQVQVGGWVRLRLSQNALDYAGLGEARGMGSQESWLKLLSLLKERVPEKLLDEGCLKMRPRPMLVEGVEFRRLAQGKIDGELSRSYPEFYSAVRWLREIK